MIISNVYHNVHHALDYNLSDYIMQPLQTLHYGNTEA